MKCKKFDFIIIAAVFVITFIYVFHVDGARGLWKALEAANPAWLGAAVGLMGIYWMLEALILHLSVKQFHPFQPFSNSLQTAMIGQLFNCITPFASGGQPAQALHLGRAGVPVGACACALTVKFVVYQFVLTVYSSITLLFRFADFSEQIYGLKYLVLAGFTVNTAVIMGLLGVCFGRRGTEKFLENTIRFFTWMKLIRNPETLCRSMKSQTELFYNSFSAIRKNRRLLAKMGILSAVQLTAYFLIPYTLLRCFHIRPDSVFSMLVAQAFVLNVSSFVPLPGAAGGAEYSFHTMFAMFFPVQLLALAVLLWRIVTFYLPICVGTAFLWNGSKRQDKRYVL